MSKILKETNIKPLIKYSAEGTICLGFFKIFLAEIKIKPNKGNIIVILLNNYAILECNIK